MCKFFCIFVPEFNDDTMQTAQQNLTEHYSNAVLAIQNDKCLAFLTCLRPCIEWLGQVLVYDLLGEKMGKDLISGRIRLVNNQDVLPEHAKSLYGSAYFTVLPKLYAVTNAYQRIPLEKKANCNPKSIVECACDSILDAYKTCSQISEHAGNHSMDPQLQAYNYGLLIPSFIDKIRNFNLLSKPTQVFFDNLFENNRVIPVPEEEASTTEVPSPTTNAPIPDARMFLQGD